MAHIQCIYALKICTLYIGHIYPEPNFYISASMRAPEKFERVSLLYMLFMIKFPYQKLAQRAKEPKLPQIISPLFVVC